MKVIGVEPEQADDAYRTWKSGTIQSLPASPQTLADGVRTTAIGRRNFEVMFANRLVDAIVTVTEEEIGEAVRVAWTRLQAGTRAHGLPPAGRVPRRQAAGGQDRADAQRRQRQLRNGG